MKRIKLELTEDQVDSLGSLLLERIEDINDYTFPDDQVGEKALADERAFLRRLYQKLYK